MSETPEVPTSPAPRRTNGFGFAALGLGIIALLGSGLVFVNFLSAILAVAGLILGVVGLTRKGTGKGTSVAGTIVSGIALVVAIVVSIFLLNYSCCQIQPTEEAPIASAQIPIASAEPSHTD